MIISRETIGRQFFWWPSCVWRGYEFLWLFCQMDQVFGSFDGWLTMVNACSRFHISEQIGYQNHRFIANWAPVSWISTLVYCSTNPPLQKCKSLGCNKKTLHDYCHIHGHVYNDFPDIVEVIRSCSSIIVSR
jgi:hypothetical protein